MLIASIKETSVCLTKWNWILLQVWLLWALLYVFLDLLFGDPFPHYATVQILMDLNILMVVYGCQPLFYTWLFLLSQFFFPKYYWGILPITWLYICSLYLSWHNIVTLKCLDFPYIPANSRSAKLVKVKKIFYLNDST